MHLEASIKLNSEMHLEAAIKGVWRLICRPRSGIFEMNLDAVIERVGDALAGRDGARSGEYLEAVDRRCARR
jgi:hypothetical protein